MPGPRIVVRNMHVKTILEVCIIYASRNPPSCLLLHEQTPTYTGNPSPHTSTTSTQTRARAHAQPQLCPCFDCTMPLCMQPTLVYTPLPSIHTPSVTVSAPLFFPLSFCRFSLYLSVSVSLCMYGYVYAAPTGRKRGRCRAHHTAVEASSNANSIPLLHVLHRSCKCSLTWCMCAVRTLMWRPGYACRLHPTSTRVPRVLL